MALTKEQKKKIIEDLKEKIARQKAMVFAGIEGVKVKDLSNLRRNLKAQNCEIKVAKKTLLELALKEKGIAVGLKSLEGEVALVLGYKDEILPAKITYEFSREKANLKILGGFIENKFKEAEEIIILAKLPSREELLAKLVGSISSPISGLANVLQGNIKGLIYALSAIKTNK